MIESQARPTSRGRPCPLNTIELQKRASRFLRMSSDTTMKVAESLYQRGILSYPRYKNVLYIGRITPIYMLYTEHFDRTETDFFKEGFDLLSLLADHRGHSTWGPFINRLLDDGLFQEPRKGGHDDQGRLYCSF